MQGGEVRMRLIRADAIPLSAIWTSLMCSDPAGYKQAIIPGDRRADGLRPRFTQ